MVSIATRIWLDIVMIEIDFWLRRQINRQTQFITISTSWLCPWQDAMFRKLNTILPQELLCFRSRLFAVKYLINSIVNESLIGSNGIKEQNWYEDVMRSNAWDSSIDRVVAFTCISHWGWVATESTMNPQGHPVDPLLFNKRMSGIDRAIYLHVVPCL